MGIQILHHVSSTSTILNALVSCTNWHDCVVAVFV